jgi:hypothetical protein
MSIDRYLSRMSKNDVWPAAHSPGEVFRAFGELSDTEWPRLRWTSNGRPPMDDMLAALLILDLITREQADEASTTRAAEIADLLKGHRADWRPGHASKPDAEELSEMRAAFGPGVTVVNVITGRTTEL